MSKYETVIGLEVHLELSTASKIFCACSTSFGSEPNSNVCPVCLGQPGVLPVLNEEVVDRAIQAALALNCSLASYSKFDRKNYFYPDLPKAYQISQYDLPLAENGHLEIEIDGEKKVIGITRIHLEEDAGKLVHGEDGQHSFVDYNRTGVPLIEIVSEPDMRSPQEAKLYLEKLKRYLEYTEVSDCKMEEGSLRCDANISIRPLGSKEFGTRIELKNMNSFKAIERALEYEVERQIEEVAAGKKITQETRRFDEAKQQTFSMRSKEDAHDYRYFPDPDLPPVEISSQWIARIQESMPELPDARLNRFVVELNLSAYDARVITSSKPLANFFEECLKLYPDAKIVANWIMGELLRLLKDNNMQVDNLKITPDYLAELLVLQKEGVISGKIAKDIFKESFTTGKKPATIVEEKGLKQISDTSFLENLVQEVILNNPQPVQEYRQGKKKAFGFLVGQVMKATKGQANPQVVNEILRKRI